VGLSTALCRRSLLSVGSVDLLPSTQCICFAFTLSCFLFVLKCFAHVSLLWRCMPRYFTSFFWGRSPLSICTIGHIWLRRVNVKFEWICFDSFQFSISSSNRRSYFYCCMRVYSYVAQHGSPDCCVIVVASCVYWFVIQQQMSFHCWSRVVWNVFTEPLPSNASQYYGVKFTESSVK
jgi:hypothetical protein